MANIKGIEEEENYIYKIIDNIRALGIDMISEAKSGHPGIVLGAAPIIATLYANHMKVKQDDPLWINRDRFVMSAGHGSALLYATLFMAGYDIPFEELKNFRKLNSLTPGHPEYKLTNGVDVSTGPLGQGFATSVGMAISERFLKNYFGEKIIDHYTYVLCGDGDLMEGISYEAASLAGHLNLNKLIVLYDSNDITLDGELKTSFNEDIKGRFEAMGWNYLKVEDGEDASMIDLAITEAKKSESKPTIIEIKTVIGKYSKNEGTCKVHGSPLDLEDINAIKERLNLRPIPFAISLETQNMMKNLITERNDKVIETWIRNLEELDVKKKKDILLLISGDKPIKLQEIDYDYPEDGKDSTRNWRKCRCF